MKGVGEGRGSLLDNTVVPWCNELGVGNTHTRRDMPYVLAGSAGGHFQTGRYLQYQGDSHNDPLPSLSQAMGLERTSFGNPVHCTGPLSRLTG